MQRVSQRHEACGDTRYGTLEGYYNAMLRLHERHSEYPYNTLLESEFLGILIT